MTGRVRLGSVVAGAYVALVLGFLMLPVAVVVLASFSSTSYLTVPPQGVTLRWYGRLLDSADYLAAIGTSVTLAADASTSTTVPFKAWRLAPGASSGARPVRHDAASAQARTRARGDRVEATAHSSPFRVRPQGC